MSKNESEVISGGLVVSHRPQVLVELESDGRIAISTASISDDFNSVEHDVVRFPVECAREIAEELYRLAEAASEADGSDSE